MHELSDTVGTGGANNAPDVRVVQQLLTRAASLTLDDRLSPGPVDGLSGDGTEGAIVRLQRRLGIRTPDGRIDPGGYTWRRLTALLAIGDVAWAFPFTAKPDKPFVGPGAGMRSFGWRRGNGRRAHAGVDLYAPAGTPIRAVSHGVVRRVSYFYLQTDAIEVVHKSVNGHAPFVVRYGEVKPQVAEGDRVARGETIAMVGQMKHSNGQPFAIGGVPTAMLHFELYDGTTHGALTNNSTRCARHLDNRPFFRRRDLVDPTGLLARTLPG